MYIDLLIKIKNAQAAKKESLKAKFTKMNKAILDILVSFDFIKKAEVKGRSYKKYIDIELNQDKSFEGLRFLSKPSRRLYAGYSGIKKVKGSRGLLFVSTSKGIMTGEQAKKQKVGGQMLFEVW